MFRILLDIVTCSLKRSDTAYYLTEDTILTNSIAVYGGETLNLCLNGYKLIQSENVPVIKGNQYNNVNICDCSGNRKGTITHVEEAIGSGLELRGGNTALYGITVSDNEADFYGGILSSGGSARLLIEDCTVTNNTAAYDGGGISAFGELVIRNSLIDGNKALNQAGGGIYAWGTTNIENSIISNNKAGSGGGVHAFGERSDILTIVNSSIIDNEADGSSGIAVGSNSAIVTNSIVSRNRSITPYLGVISGAGDYIQLNNVNVTDNIGTGVYAIHTNDITPPINNFWWQN